MGYDAVDFHRGQASGESPEAEGGIHGVSATTGALLLMAALVPLSGCELQRSAEPPPTVSVSVMPAFVCGSEEVAVTWDAGEQTDSPACRPGFVGSGAGDAPSRDRCILVDRSSSPSLPRWEGAGDIRSQGTIVVSVTETTTFDAHAAVANYEGSGRSVALDASATARVIEETEPPGPTALPFTFAGVCAGAVATWTGVNLKEETSGCLEVLEVCSTSAESIQLTEAESGRRDTLTPDERCTDVFNGRGPNLNGRGPNLAGSILGFVAPPGLCGAEMTTGVPPSFGILVHVQCNRDLPSCAF